MALSDIKTLLGTAAVLMLVGCAVAPPPQESPAPQAAWPALADWSARDLPGKRPTRYSVAQRDGRRCVLAEANRSVSLWRRPLQLAPNQLGTLQFDWWLGGFDHQQATVSAAATDDAPARLLLGFEGDEDKLSMRNRMQFELVRTLTGEAPPYATLVYVWDAKAAAETLVVSTRSDRVRKIVVGSGPRAKGSWQRLHRDVRADYERAFGEAPGRLTTIAMMTDGDNTASRAEACYGSILLFGADGALLEGSLQL